MNKDGALILILESVNYIEGSTNKCKNCIYNKENDYCVALKDVKFKIHPDSRCDNFIKNK